MRRLKRLFRPLLLAHLSYQRKHSESEVARLRMLREDAFTRESQEHVRQVMLTQRIRFLEGA
jgi:hypothetical protein